MLLNMLFERLTEGQIDGLIVTTPADQCRIKIGAQIVKALVSNGFVGGDEKWKNIIFVGTKADRASPDELEAFENDFAPDFFEQAEQNEGPYCLVGFVEDTKVGPPKWMRNGNRFFHQALLDTIEDLPNFKKLEFNVNDNLLEQVATAGQLNDADACNFKQRYHEIQRTNL